jgi:hypothetical protein
MPSQITLFKRSSAQVWVLASEALHSLASATLRLVCSSTSSSRGIADWRGETRTGTEGCAEPEAIELRVIVLAKRISRHWSLWIERMNTRLASGGPGYGSLDASALMQPRSHPTAARLTSEGNAPAGVASNSSYSGRRPRWGDMQSSWRLRGDVAPIPNLHHHHHHPLQPNTPTWAAMGTRSLMLGMIGPQPASWGTACQQT